MTKTNRKADIAANPTNHQAKPEHQKSAYYDNLARISATLLAALLALFTFLLVVGVQNQIKGFSTPLYAAISILGASLVLYVVGHAVCEIHCALLNRSNVSNKQKKFSVVITKALLATRILQQLVFAAGIGAVVWFAVSYGELVINPKPVQQPSVSRQAAPSTNESGTAPGETAEQHAEEMKKAQQ